MYGGLHNKNLSIPTYGHSDLDDQAEALEDWIRFEYDGEYSSIWADLINNSLAEVDWYEIVEKNQE